MKHIKSVMLILWVIGLVAICAAVSVYDPNWLSVEYID